MTPADKLPQEILREHLFKTIDLTDQEFDYFFSHFKLLSLKKGQTIIKQEDKVDSEYFVLTGCIKTFYINQDLKMYILQFAMSEWWASDYGALYGDGIATVNIDCITDAEVLCLKSADRAKLCRENYKISDFFHWRSNRGFVAQQKRLLSFMNNDTQARYHELLKMYPHLYNLVPKQLIAAYLGVSRETLSRLH